MKKIFVAATSRNDGKTTVALGIIAALQEQTRAIGFIKPVGQRYLETPRGRFDEDAVLVDRVCALPCTLEHMSPVTVGRGFTRDYIMGERKHDLARHVLESFAAVADGKEVVVIEGTGHAGVGSVIDLSNARVARLLEAPVLIVSVGGIGRPIDEVALNLELFRAEGVRVLGVVLNKVGRDKLEMIRTVAGRGFERIGVRLFGTIPDEPLLAELTMRIVLQEIGGRLVNGADNLDRPIRRIVIGAMTPHQFLDYFAPNSLVITGGDREDLILAAMSSHIGKAGQLGHVAGIILTGGIMPHASIMQLVNRTDVPAIVVPDDSYRTASVVHDLTAKIQPEDSAKIAAVRELVRTHVDLAGIYNSL